MDQDNFVDVLETAIKAANLEPEQLRAFRLSLIESLEVNPLNDKEKRDGISHNSMGSN